MADFGGVLGLMLWAQFPLSGAWAMGTLLGIKLFFIGLIMVTSGSTVLAITEPKSVQPAAPRSQGDGRGLR